MRKLIYLIPFLLFACSSTDEEQEESSSTAAEAITVDSTQALADVEESSDSAQLTANILSKMSLPYTIDSTLTEALFDISTLQKLNTERVRELADQLLTTGPSEWEKYKINTFCYIDSLKKVGAYSDYVDTLDLGMIQESEAFSLGIIALDVSYSIQFWFIRYSSYEACPWSTGVNIYATIMQNEQIEQCTLFAEQMHAGDPPSHLDSYLSGTISVDGNLLLKRLSISTYDDEEGEEKDIERSTAEYIIVDGEILPVKS